MAVITAVHKNGAQAQRRMPPDQAPEWVETPTSKKIFAALDRARRFPGISVVYGSPGVGKTIAARRYAGDGGPYSKRRSGTCYVSIPGTGSSRTAVLHLIAEAFDIRPLRGYGPYGTFELQQDITSRLGPGCLIVIDEAQMLGTHALDCLRYFLDDANVGIAYLGNEYVYRRFASGAHRAEYAQLFSRVVKWLRIDKPDPGDTDAILEAWGVSGREEREFARQIAGEAGGLRVLSEQVLRAAAVIAKAEGRPIDIEMMQAALEERGADV